MNCTYCISVQPNLHTRHLENELFLDTLLQITSANGYPGILLENQILELKAKVPLS